MISSSDTNASPSLVILTFLPTGWGWGGAKEEVVGVKKKEVWIGRQQFSAPFASDGINTCSLGGGLELRHSPKARFAFPSPLHGKLNLFSHLSKSPTLTKTNFKGKPAFSSISFKYLEIIFKRLVN